MPVPVPVFMFVPVTVKVLVAVPSPAHEFNHDSEHALQHLDNSASFAGAADGG